MALDAVVIKCSVQRSFESKQEGCVHLMQRLPVLYLENIKGVILLAVHNVK